MNAGAVVRKAPVLRLVEPVSVEFTAEREQLIRRGLLVPAGTSRPLDLSQMPTLKLDAAGHEAAAKEIRDFQKRGPRLEMDHRWRRGSPSFGLPERELQ